MGVMDPDMASEDMSSSLGLMTAQLKILSIKLKTGTLPASFLTMDHHIGRSQVNRG
jgi:hypothetical protein